MSTDSSLIVQKDTRKKKKKLSVKEIIRRSSSKFRKEQKARRKGKYTDPFPDYEYVHFKQQVRKLRDDATEDEKEANAEAAVETALVMKKGYPNLPTQRGIQIGKTRGNGKTFIGSKGRIRTRRRMKPSQKGKRGVVHA